MSGQHLDNKPLHIPGTTVRTRRDHRRLEFYVDISIPLHDLLNMSLRGTRQTAYAYSALLAIALDEVHPGGLLHDKWVNACAKARMMGLDNGEDTVSWT